MTNDNQGRGHPDVPPDFLQALNQLNMSYQTMLIHMRAGRRPDVASVRAAAKGLQALLPPKS